MNKLISITALLAATLFAAETVQAGSVMSVSYGTITGINQQSKDTSSGARGGALMGGIIGLASGRGGGRSDSDRALRVIGGAAVGSAVGRSMATGVNMVYTVDLVKGSTVRVVINSGNFHRGDCVAVEQGGGSANIRRVSGEFCTNNAAVPQEHKKEHQKEADECAQAKKRLLAAKTEAEVNTAISVMNILCQD